MRIGGLQKVSLIDFPGKIAAVVFTQGCPWRCGYCHNPSLVLPEQFGQTIDEAEVLAYLQSRIGKLEGVVISGGEPTLQPDLGEFVAKVAAMGYAIKLDTNGIYPERLAKLLESKNIHYIAMDIKAGWDNYSAVVGVSCDVDAIKKSMALIRVSGVAYEWRTTVAPELPIDTAAIATMLNKGETLHLQKFRPAATNLNPALSQTVSSDFESAALVPLVAAEIVADWR